VARHEVNASYDLDGKVALVTGAARGIGYETARSLVARGASVAIVDLDAAQAEAAAARVHDTRAIGLAADVSDRGAMQQAVAATVERLGRLDVVVANAGISPTYSTFRAMATELFERTIEVNLMGVVRTVEAALPEVVRNRGHVVVVASAYAFQNGVGLTPYAMAKAGVEQFGRALRLELRPHGASASVAYFGLIDTKLVHDAIDADPAATKLLSAAPKAMLKRLPPSAAGEAIARGIERRAPRIIRPRIYVPLSALRGVVAALTDRRFERDERVAEAVREMDARADREQTTTA
jgi:NAD(P)-dependent dehydrogenase (short-subunit alcohol dehydrogenase family)